MQLIWALIHHDAIRNEKINGRAVRESSLDEAVANNNDDRELSEIWVFIRLLVGVTTGHCFTARLSELMGYLRNDL